MKEVYCKVNESPNRIPDTSLAEKWIDSETFLYKGKVWKVLPDGKIVEVKDDKENDNR